MDRACYDILSQLDLSDVYLIALEDFERNDDELFRAKQNRTLIEYYFTCTPSLSLFILNNCPEVDIITYLDSDLFFFADPALIYDEIADHSIAIIGHRFPLNLRHLEQNGIYNVGWLSFQHDEHALACLRWWRERCIEWCYDWYENGRFADQKYLDHWPSLFQGVVVLRHKGANLAPWNLANYKIHADGNRVWVDEQPLIFFHFHGLRQIKSWLYDSSLSFYKVRLSAIVRQSIYSPYIRMLLDLTQQVLPLLETCPLRIAVGGQMTRLHSPQRVPLARRVVRRLIKALYLCRGIVAGDYISAINGRVV